MLRYVSNSRIATTSAGAHLSPRKRDDYQTDHDSRPSTSTAHYPTLSTRPDPLLAACLLGDVICSLARPGHASEPTVPPPERHVHLETAVVAIARIDVPARGHTHRRQDGRTVRTAPRWAAAASTGPRAASTRAACSRWSRPRPRAARARRRFRGQRNGLRIGFTEAGEHQERGGQVRPFTGSPP